MTTITPRGTDQGYQVDMWGNKTLVVIQGRGKPVQASLEAWQKLNEIREENNP